MSNVYACDKRRKDKHSNERFRKYTVPRSSSDVCCLIYDRRIPRSFFALFQLVSRPDRLSTDAAAAADVMNYSRVLVTVAR